MLRQVKGLMKVLSRRPSGTTLAMTSVAMTWSHRLVPNGNVIQSDLTCPAKDIQCSSCPESEALQLYFAVLPRTELEIKHAGTATLTT